MEDVNHRPQIKELKCGERIESEDGVSSVIFTCNLPDGNYTYPQGLEFSCREPSCGALEQNEQAAVLGDDDYTVDPNFFDEGYTSAGATGFKIWTGSRLLIETLAWRHVSDGERLKQLQFDFEHGANVVELGAGVGVVGSYLASVGANVLLTDLHTLVDNAIDQNLKRNAGKSDPKECPTWLQPHGRNIGKGWADCVELDWTISLEDQLTEEQITEIDYIVASDVVFLVGMLEPLLETVAAIFAKCKERRSRRQPTFILSFQRRDSKDGEDSASFTTVRRILTCVEQRGWKLDCLAWRQVQIKKEVNNEIVADTTEVFVYEITSM